MIVVLFNVPSVLEYEGTGGVNRTPIPLVQYSAIGEAMDTVGVLPGYEEFMIPCRSGDGWGSSSMIFGKRSFLSTSGEEIVMATSDEMSFDVRSPSGRLTQTVSVPDWVQSFHAGDDRGGEVRLRSGRRPARNAACDRVSDSRSSRLRRPGPRSSPSSRPRRAKCGWHAPRDEHGTTTPHVGRSSHRTARGSVR